MLHRAVFQSKLGDMILLSDEKALLGLWFADQKFFGANYQLGQADDVQNIPLKLTLRWLNDYFAGLKPDPFAIPIRPEVTAFRKAVYHELQKVPYGETTTYGELSDKLQAKQTSKTNKARAVGGAVGHNPITLIVPCHRVIGSDGSLTGYAGGIERKKALLQLERQT